VRRVLAAVAVVAALSACSDDGGDQEAKVDLAPLRAAAALDPCPASVGDVVDLTLPCLGGGPDVRLKGSGTGVPTLVNVYGSWCGPCQREMPVLASFAARAKGRVALLGVDTQDEPRLALLFAKDVGQHWPAVVDDDGVFMRRYSSGPPVTLFVDRRGKVAFVHRGPFDSVGEIVTAVDNHLGVSL